MHITKMKIGGIPPFTDPVEFTFDERVNVFIGPNATGKTSILREMHVPDMPSMPSAVNREDFTVVHNEGNQGSDFQMKFSQDWPGQETAAIASLKQELDETLRVVWERLHFWTLGRKVPWMYIPAIRQSLPLSSDAERVHDLAAKMQGPDTLSDILSEDTRYMFDSSVVLRLNHAYHEGFRSRQYSVEEISKFESAKERAWECSRDICREVIGGGREPNDYIHTLRAEGMSMPVAFYNMQMHLETDVSGPIFAGNLSAGTQGTIMWIWYIAVKLAHFYNFEEDWYKKPAVLLIDEIENQLHPTWQRRVIPALLDHFPSLQIFAATHSPFIVAGLNRGQVHKLHKDKGTIKTPSLSDEQKAQKIIGWTVEDILREFMDVPDPTDEITAEAAAALRWLRSQRPVDISGSAWQEQTLSELRELAHPTTEEKSALRWLERVNADDEPVETLWETELAKLRATVSRQLEEGGAIGAQRALFMAQLADFLDEEIDIEST